MFALISDIHSNFEALKAVYEDISEKFGAAEIICLGDSVGYNASPDNVVSFLREHDITTIMGNHDAAVAGDIDCEDHFNYYGAAGVDWAKANLSEENLEWLVELPYELEFKELFCVHGSPVDEDVDGCQYPKDIDRIQNHRNAESAIENANSFNLVAVGHTHKPAIFLSGESTTEVDYNSWQDLDGHQAVINPGSVGQPRDELNSARYAVVKPGEKKIKFKTVEYDREKAKQNIIEAGYAHFEGIAGRL